MNGIIGIKILKDDFSQDNYGPLISVGSQRNKSQEYFIIQITNTSNTLIAIEDQTLMDVFTFNTFILLCSQTDIILSYNHSLNVFKLQIPFKRVQNYDTYCSAITELYNDDSVFELNKISEN